MENIKVLLRSSCPHCGQDILVEVESPTPVVKSVLTNGDIEAAKEFVIKELDLLLKSSSITEKNHEEATAWVKDAETIFGPSDAAKIIESIKESK